MTDDCDHEFSEWHIFSNERVRTCIACGSALERKAIAGAAASPAPDLETVARAIMLDDGCGLTIEGERVLCDDPRALEQPDRCYCKRSAAAAIAALPRPFDSSGNDREQIAKIFAYIWHGDLGEWQGFLSKADAFLSYPLPRPTQAWHQELSDDEKIDLAEAALSSQHQSPQETEDTHEPR